MAPSFGYEDVLRVEDGTPAWSRQLLHTELGIYAVMADLFLDAIHTLGGESVGPAEEQEHEHVVATILTRVFNDFEAARHLLLLGFHGQMHMQLKDAIECLGLLTLLKADVKLAMRYLLKAAQYQPGSVRKELGDRGISPALYKSYAAICDLAHPNYGAAIAHVDGSAVEAGELRLYDIGSSKSVERSKSAALMLLGVLLGWLHDGLAPMMTTGPTSTEIWHRRVAAIVVILRRLDPDIA